MGVWLAVRIHVELRTFPGTSFLQLFVQNHQSADQLSLLSFQLLNVSLGVDLVLRFLAFTSG